MPPSAPGAGANPLNGDQRACPSCGALNRASANHCRAGGYTFPAQAEASPARARAWLRDQQGRSVELAQRTTIGSRPGNTVVLDDPTVSAEHAEIIQQDGSYILIDRGSTNGSFVDDRRAYRNRLRPGVRLRFGQTEWTFQMDPSDQCVAQRTG